MLKPNIGIFGLLAVIASYAFARLIRLDQEFFQPGFYTYNPLLIGLSIGAALELSWLSGFFCVVVAAMTLFLTIGLVHAFRYFFYLPVLSLPFAAASIITYLASLRYSNLLIQSPETAELLQSDFGLPIAAIGFFKSLGAVFFMPYVTIGALFALMLLGTSRILFALAISGFLVGAFVRSMMLGSTHDAFSDISSFNFILIAMALGGVFLTPSLASYAIALIAVAVSTVIADAVSVFGAQYGMPVYTLPFNIMTLGVLYALRLNAFPKLAMYVGITPEQTLENDVVNRLRYPGSFRTLSLPFFGRWNVWQAFDGDWTHKGSWRYAYDFVITDDAGETFANLGLHLEDYYCWRKPILAPVRGRVLTVVNDFPDNPIGQTDKTNNWGNHVVIYDERGYYIEMSHFAEGSIRVAPGDWVEIGQAIGLCGNSGYSPQPHLHMHVQAYNYVGSYTLPFSFVSYLDDNCFHSNDTPEKGAVVEPGPLIEPALDAATGFLLGDKIQYGVYQGGKRIASVNWLVDMAIDGTMCLQSDFGRLYFGKHAGTFYVYSVDGKDPYLRALWAALPRLPLSYRKGVSWNDFIPISLIVSGIRRGWADLAASVVSDFAVAKTHSCFVSPTRIETKTTDRRFTHRSTISVVEIDAEKGFSLIETESMTLRREAYVPAATT